MCRGNLAQASANFINAQLSALWENSKVCNEKDSGKKDIHDVVTKHGVSLREYRGHTDDETDSASFHGIFQTPHIEFLCNHELVLLLKVEDGHYKSTHSLQSTTVAVRLSYHFDDLSTVLDGKHCTLSILSMNISSATLIPESCTTAKGESHVLEPLFSFFKDHYIPTLVDAGHLNLFVLPPSYAGKREIDHGVTISRISSLPFICGIKVETLGELLHHHWLEAISYHYAHKEGSTSLRDIYLAQYQASWSEGEWWATYQFSPLRIQVLCETEVVLYFKANIQVFSDEEQKEHECDLKDWEVAVIFQVVQQDHRILLDRFSPPRLAPYLCSLPCQPEDEEFRDEFKKSILTHYIEYIFEFGHYQLYPEFHKPSGPIRYGGPDHGDHGHGGHRNVECHHGSHCHCGGGPTEPGPKPIPGPWPHHHLPLPVGPYCPGWKDTKFSIDWATLWGSFIGETSLHGHHQLMSVTQAGINAYFLALWNKAKTIGYSDAHKHLLILTHFDSKTSPVRSVAHMPHFSCDLGAPQVELVTGTNSRSVIVYFFVQNISFELSDKVHQFKDWILAFQFDLKLVSGNTADEYKLILDSNTATLLHHRSSFGSLIQTKETEVIRSLYGSLSTNFFERYIKAFVQAEQHILYTIPISSHDHHIHGAADIAFSIVPFSLSSFNGHVFQGIGGKSHHIVERNMIVFYFVTRGTKHPNPPLPGPYGAPSPHPPHGTLLLSRQKFLEACILQPLAQINARTTILCTFKGVQRNNWNVSLETWNNQRLNDECEWELEANRGGSLQYKWANSEEWRYDAHGRGIATGTYSVVVKTNNKLSIPTTNHFGRLLMQLEGECSVFMQYEVQHQQHWFGELKATWKTPIELVSDSHSGLSVKCDKQIRVLFEKNSQDISGHSFDAGRTALENVDKTFRAAFSSSINVSEIISGISERFSGVYKGLSLPHADFILSEPMFTANGDLLLHLLVKAVEQPIGGHGTLNGSIRKRAKAGSASPPIFATSHSIPVPPAVISTSVSGPYKSGTTGKNTNGNGLPQGPIKPLTLVPPTPTSTEGTKKEATPAAPKANDHSNGQSSPKDDASASKKEKKVPAI
ncbi:hypothetical protein D9757_009753 [Collybiopsis confluens]|uniref:Uncharacterized protein n=1 Tax=Collybiopsis confluens TaxID=2823264 RepID=A0A8H5GYJ0_9AGAR|nr:hypothetical protein D9757_009753 [Collybiopsis confluens]